MDLATKSVRAGSWELVSVLGQALIQVSVASFLAHRIAPSDFGLYAVAGIAVGAVAMFSEIGVGPAVLQKKELTEDFSDSAFTLSLLFGATASVLTWVSAPLIANFFHMPAARNVVRAVGMTLFLAAFCWVSTARLEREFQYRSLAIINLVSYVVGFGIVGCVLAIIGMNIWALVTATISQTAVRAFMLYCKLPASCRVSFSKNNMAQVVRFGAGVTLGRVSNYMAGQIDSIASGRYLGPAALGVYSMAFQIVDLPRRFLGSAVDRVFFAATARIQDDPSRLRSGYLRTIELNNVILLPATVFLIISAADIVGLFLGGQWKAAIVPMQILLTQVPLRASVRIGDQIGTAVGKVYLVGATKILYAIMIGIATIAGLRWGITGIATTVTLATIVNWIVMTIIALRITKATFYDYLATWIPGCLLMVVVTATSLGMKLVVPQFQSEFTRILLLMLTNLAILVPLIFFRPSIVGTTALQLMAQFRFRSFRLPLPANLQ